MFHSAMFSTHVERNKFSLRTIRSVFGLELRLSWWHFMVKFHIKLIIRVTSSWRLKLKQKLTKLHSLALIKHLHSPTFLIYIQTKQNVFILLTVSWCFAMLHERISNNCCCRFNAADQFSWEMVIARWIIPIHVKHNELHWQIPSDKLAVSRQQSTCIRKLMKTSSRRGSMEFESVWSVVSLKL